MYGTTRLMLRASSFLVYINDLHLPLNHSEVNMYADGTSISFSSDSISILFYFCSVLEQSKVAYNRSPFFSILSLTFQFSIFSNVGPFLDVINPHSSRSSL